MNESLFSNGYMLALIGPLTHLPLLKRKNKNNKQIEKIRSNNWRNILSNLEYYFIINPVERGGAKLEWSVQLKKS